MAIRGTERNPAHAVLNTPAAKQGIKTIVFDPGRSESVTFDGLSFGSVGQYQKLRGIAYGEVDPLDPRNAVITDIELAPVNAEGMVEYSMDIFILKPVDLNRGNHRILFDFNNRGQMRVGLFNDAVLTNNPTSTKHAGTGFIMNQGYTVVGSGWEPAVSGADAMKITVPVVTKKWRCHHRAFV